MSEISTSDIQQWLHSVGDNSWRWFLKRLSCNDTGQTGSHQVGIYLPNEAAFQLFPTLNDRVTKNPDVFLDASTDSHNRPQREIRGIYYNTKHSEGRRNGRDECRITRWKSADPQSPLQDVNNTGALSLFAFNIPEDNTACKLVRVWVCRNAAEEDFLEDIVGQIYPGENLYISGSDASGGIPVLPATTDIREVEIPEVWKVEFPSGAEIVNFTFQLDKKLVKELPDKRLMKRRELEFKLFRMIEDSHLLPRIAQGFSSVENFVKLANSVSNRRKSRGGRSLELHLEQIFREEGLSSFATQAVTEGNKKPDFLFPSEVAYHDDNYPTEKLRMLAVKTTCKDRWRQILNEANRIDQCHLITLQEGVSENQFSEMQAEGVILVVPQKMKAKYPEAIRDQLMTLEDFVRETKALYAC
ncbi:MULTISPECIES: type II restriction endonuclease [unclassified Endozoicomonas]|uniref:type II restriction endonuclease n=1 Tax=unclassified Endozoicomonas TaxID=2644528 RepID=UPI003BB6E995